MSCKRCSRLVECRFRQPAFALFSTVSSREEFMHPQPFRVLILCTGNSARSQMAEGLLRHLDKERGDNRYEVHSAGTRASAVRPEAIQVMAELGIDISGHRSKNVDEFTGQDFDYVITVCDHANEVCPVFSSSKGPGKTQRIHHSFVDPPAPDVGDVEYRLGIFRQVRDEINAWLPEFIRKTKH
jgi:arsenate reductase (thioredoxin)